MAFLDKVNELRDCVFNKKSNVAVIGLPGSGISKLIEESLKSYYKQNKGKETLKNFIFVDLTLSEKDDFFELIARKVLRQLSKIVDEDNYLDFKKQYDCIGEASNEFDRFENIAEFLEDVKDESFCIAVSVDNFHKVQSYFESSDYGKIRRLTNDGIIFVLGSIYPIEMLETCRGDKSNLQQVFVNRIPMGVADESDFNEYFENANKEKEELKSYKEKIVELSGRLPGIFTKCITEFGYGHSEENVIKTVNAQFDGIEKKLKEKEHLLDEAMKVVIGPMYKIDHDKVMTLLYYDYLKRVPLDYKKDLLRRNLFDEVAVDNFLGLQEEDSCYVLFSDYYTIRFIRKYQYNRDYFPIWNETERLLRQMVRCRFKAEYGFNYETKLLEEHEILASSERQRKIECKDFGGNDLDILEYIDTNSLFDLFILQKKYWKYYNENIFKGNKAGWKEHFELLCAMRRPLCHCREFPTISEFYSKAEIVCEKISKAIKNSGCLENFQKFEIQ